MTEPTAYPMCDKLRLNAVARVTLLDFFEWLHGERGLAIVKEIDRTPFYTTSGINADDLILEFLGIDKTELENERRAMLESIQNGVMP